jgi:hypothetical protein
MPQRMTDRGAHDEHFSEQALVPRAVPEICGDYVSNASRGVFDRLLELGKVGATPLQRRRTIPQERFALALKDGG